ncbi:MAG: RNA polymerase sigma factor [Bryobacteraceae bacterium]
MTEQLALPEQMFEWKKDRARCDDRFSALVERQSRFVFGVAYSILRNVHDSDDVVQETFLKLYRTRSWQTIENERAFLARVAWRISVDRLSTMNADVPQAGPPCRGENPEQAAITADWNGIVHRLIDALPEPLRQPIALSTVEDLNSHEIAAIMEFRTERYVPG